ncbi:MAG TPA: 16S rRNA (guanine(527)-N(7))-methyltransferase RsmG [Roseiflexaceae bacterium]|nr:16S rRNA (guanine(527)-N(7))-methyltransferase RsmG [Roseiflexaceae bacterium]
MTTDRLAATAADWGLQLTQAQLDQLALYADALRRWNERVNLTAITDEPGIATRHFLDSLRCALSWGPKPESLIDIGAGAGFPGLPLKILRPELRLTLVESIAKKATFLRHIADTLGLAHVEVVVARAETVGRDESHRERYAVAAARAVADLRVLAEYCLPLCRVGGRFLAPKGGSVEDELQAALPAIELLGGRLVAVEPVELPGVEPRTLVVVEKVSPTPPRYPRAPGVPAKRPL